MTGKCFIGTSGWSYDHWAGVFYPPDLKTADRLNFYINHFNSVEINNTFYHLPTPSAFKSWKKIVPKNFICSLKGSRFITHMKKLKDPKEPLELFLERARLLKDNLGPILFQLPPHWRCNTERLKEFVKLLSSNIRFAFEFREPSWFNKEVYDILRENNIALYVYFNNDANGYAVINAKELMEIVSL